VLAAKGGVLVLDDGTVELVGPLRELDGEPAAINRAAA
jgi:hypothetical protein